MEPTETFLEPAEYVDSAAPGIVDFARRVCEGAPDDVTKAVRLYYAIRDGIAYTPYCDFKTPRELMGTDVFYYHGYTELFLGDRWVKATPAFDRSLCERFGVRPLDFDGREDSLFHPLDVAGRRHMEYVGNRGAFADVPVALILETFNRCYPRLTAGAPPPSATAFRREASPIQSDPGE